MEEKTEKVGRETCWTDAKFMRIAKTAEKHLGMPGRMLFRSKGLGNPTTIFNANIFSARAKKIWFGDLDLEIDREALLKISQRMGTLYILCESDGRFLECMPGPVYLKIHAWAVVEDGRITYSSPFQERIDMLTRKKQEAEWQKSGKRRVDGKR